MAVGGTVTVACKLPNGLILQMQTMDDAFEPMMGGGSRETKRARKVGDAVRVYGWSVPLNVRPAFVMAGGYALTPNVNADFFAAWMEQNKDSDIVVKKLIFAHSKEESAVAQSREQSLVSTGLEPVDPEKHMFSSTIKTAEVARK